MKLTTLVRRVCSSRACSFSARSFRACSVSAYAIRACVLAVCALCLTLPAADIARADVPIYESAADFKAAVNSMPDAFPDAPELESPAAIAVELGSGTILYAKNATDTRYPASTTKILTGLLAIEHLNLDDIITYSRSAIGSLTPGSSNIALVVDEEVSVRDSLYGLLLPSANECAAGLAEQTSGSIPSFVKLMNETAESFGCLNTHFVNPSGLHDEEHYSCAYDLALIMSHCVENPTFLQIDSAASYAIQPTNRQPEVRNMRTTDEMKRNYSEYYDRRVIGAKTGWTEDSGRNLVTYAEDNGMEVIVVVMGTETPHQYLDTKALLDYCFTNFRLIRPADESTLSGQSIETPSGQISDSSLFRFGKEGTVLLPASLSLSDLDAEYEQNGDSLSLIYSLDGYRLGKADLVRISLTGGTASRNPDLLGRTYANLITIPLLYVLIALAAILLVTAGTSFYLKKTRTQRDLARYEKRREQAREKAEQLRKIAEQKIDS